jgi:hypothetical protein
MKAGVAFSGLCFMHLQKSNFPEIFLCLVGALIFYMTYVRFA